MNNSQYKYMLRPHERALRQLVLDFEYFKEDLGLVNVFSISTRLKSFNSAQRKAVLLKCPIKELQDLAGLQIVAATEQDVDIISRFFYRQQDSKDLEIESDKKISREDGYRARHIIFQVRPRYTRTMHEARVEAQLLTVFEHSFNFLSRSWVYKSLYNFPESWRENFISLSSQLREVDKKVNQLHSEAFGSKASVVNEAAITPISFRIIVQGTFKETIPLSEAVDSCRFVVDLGLKTNEQLISFFTDPRIKSLREELLTSPAPFAENWRNFVTSSTMHNFWLFFGVRYDYTINELQKAKKLPDDEVADD
jgi:ppGpp synthetase/RelA/SpoT-type nucleotidyltranferase